MPQSRIPLSAAYHQYQIMPILDLHMQRVAAVALTITQHLSSRLSEAEERNITAACLLHDMGNIVKFDLTQFPQFLEPEGSHYWTQVQDGFKQKYGPVAHVVTRSIVSEMGVSDRVAELVEAVGFEQAEANIRSTDIAKKICAYSDVRVTPIGVTTLYNRLKDLDRRYASKYPRPEELQKRLRFREICQTLEQQIFASCTIEPDEITELSVASLRDDLAKFEFDVR